MKLLFSLQLIHILGCDFKLVLFNYWESKLFDKIFNHFQINIWKTKSLFPFLHFTRELLKYVGSYVIFIFKFQKQTFILCPDPCDEPWWSMKIQCLLPFELEKKLNWIYLFLSLRMEKFFLLVWIHHVYSRYLHSHANRLLVAYRSWRLNRSFAFPSTENTI